MPGDGGLCSIERCSVEGRRIRPVRWLTPVPSARDTVNQGMGWQGTRCDGHAQSRRLALGGSRAPVPATLGAASRRATAVGRRTKSNHGRERLRRECGAGGRFGSAASPVQPAGASSAPAAPAAPRAGAIENQVPTPLAAPPTMPAPAATPTPGPAMTGLAPASDPRTVLSGPSMPYPGSIPLGASSAGPKPGPRRPQQMSPVSSAGIFDAGDAGRGTRSEKPEPPANCFDPLLGPSNPDSDAGDARVAG